MMSLLMEDDTTLPLDFNTTSHDPEKLNEYLELHDGSVPMVAKASGRMSPIRARTMKEYDQQIAELKKENFSLKLRIYFLEERMQAQLGDGDDFLKTNIELKVELETLKRDILDKQELLKKASSALESISAQHEGELKTAKRQAAEKAKSELREPLEQANAKVAQLEDDFSEKQQDVHLLERLLKESEAKLRDAVLDAQSIHQQNSELRDTLSTPEDGRDHVNKESVDRELGDKDRIIAQLKSILKTKELIIEQQEEETKDTVKQVQRPLLAKVQALENQLAEKRIQLQHVNEGTDHDTVDVGSFPESVQHELSGYRHRVTELEEELKILKGDLHEKDGKISGLSNDIELQKQNAIKRDKAIQGLSHEVGKKVNEVEQLTHKLNDKESQLKKVVTDRSENHMNNQELLSGRDDVINDLETQLRERKLENERLQKAIGRRQSEVERLTKQLSLADEALREREDLLQNIREQLQEEKHKNTQKATTIENHYQALLDDAQHRVEAQERLLQRITLSLQEKDKQLQEYIDLLQNKQPQDEHKDKIINQLNQNLQQHEKNSESKAKDHELSVAQKASEIRQLKLALRERDNDIQRANDMLLTTEETIDTLEGEAKGKDVNMRQLAAALKTQQAALEKMTETGRRALQEKDIIVQQLRTSLDNKEKAYQDAIQQTSVSASEHQQQLQDKDKLLQKLADDLQSMNETHGREKHDLLVKLQEYDADIKNLRESSEEELSHASQQLQEVNRELQHKEQQLQVLLASTSADDHQPAALCNASRTVVGSETRVVLKHVIEEEKEEAKTLDDALQAVRQIYINLSHQGNLDKSVNSSAFEAELTAVENLRQQLEEGIDHSRRQRAALEKHIQQALTTSSGARQMKDGGPEMCGEFRDRVTSQDDHSGDVRGRVRSQDDHSGDGRGRVTSQNDHRGTPGDMTDGDLTRVTGASSDAVLRLGSNSSQHQLSFMSMASPGHSLISDSSCLGTSYLPSFLELPDLLNAIQDDQVLAEMPPEEVVQLVNVLKKELQKLTDENEALTFRLTSRGGDENLDFESNRAADMSDQTMVMMLQNQLKQSTSEISGLQKQLDFLKGDLFDNDKRLVISLRNQLQECQHMLECKERELNQLKHDDIATKKDVHGAEEMVKEYGASSEKKLEELKEQLRQSDNLNDLLKKQIQLNTQTEDAPSGFNPDLVVKMAKEIERLKTDLDKQKTDKDMIMRSASPSSSSSGHSLGKSRIPKLQRGPLRSSSTEEQSSEPDVQAKLTDSKIQLDYLQEKLGSTEATVRKQGDKMRYYRGLLENAGLLSRRPSRSRSESNLSLLLPDDLSFPTSNLSMSNSSSNRGSLEDISRTGLRSANQYESFGKTEDTGELRSQIDQLKRHIARSGVALMRGLRLRKGSCPDLVALERIENQSPITTERAGIAQLVKHSASDLQHSTGQEPVLFDRRVLEPSSTDTAHSDLRTQNKDQEGSIASSISQLAGSQSRAISMRRHLVNGCALLDQLVPADEEGTVQITPQRVSYLRQTMQQCVELADCFSLNVSDNLSVWDTVGGDGSEETAYTDQNTLKSQIPKRQDNKRSEEEQAIISEDKKEQLEKDVQELVKKQSQRQSQCENLQESLDLLAEQEKRQNHRILHLQEQEATLLKDIGVDNFEHLAQKMLELSKLFPNNASKSCRLVGTLEELLNVQHVLESSIDKLKEERNDLCAQLGLHDTQTLHVKNSPLHKEVSMLMAQYDDLKQQLADSGLKEGIQSAEQVKHLKLSVQQLEQKEKLMRKDISETFSDGALNLLQHRESLLAQIRQLETHGATLTDQTEPNRTESDESFLQHENTLLQQRNSELQVELDKMSRGEYGSGVNKGVGSTGRQDLPDGQESMDTLKEERDRLRYNVQQQKIYIEQLENDQQVTNKTLNELKTRFTSVEAMHREQLDEQQTNLKHLASEKGKIDKTLKETLEKWKSLHEDMRISAKEKKVVEERLKDLTLQNNQCHLIIQDLKKELIATKAKLLPPPAKQHPHTRNISAEHMGKPHIDKSSVQSYATSGGRASAGSMANHGSEIGMPEQEGAAFDVCDGEFQPGSQRSISHRLYHDDTVESIERARHPASGYNDLHHDHILHPDSRSFSSSHLTHSQQHSTPSIDAISDVSNSFDKHTPLSSFRIRDSGDIFNGDDFTGKDSLCGTVISESGNTSLPNVDVSHPLMYSSNSVNNGTHLQTGSDDKWTHDIPLGSDANRSSTMAPMAGDANSRHTHVLLGSDEEWRRAQVPTIGSDANRNHSHIPLGKDANDRRDPSSEIAHTNSHQANMHVNTVTVNLLKSQLAASEQMNKLLQNELAVHDSLKQSRGTQVATDQEGVMSDLLVEVKLLRKRLQSCLLSNDGLREKLEQQLTQAEYKVKVEVNAASAKMQMNITRLEKERQSLSDKVDHLESERQQLSGTVEEVKKLCREADEKYAAVEEERDRLNEQLQEHGGLNKTLKLELNMYNTMAEQQKAPQGSPDTSQKDKQSFEQLLIQEIRLLRTQLERTIENNDSLRAKLEELSSQRMSEKSSQDSHAVHIHHYFSPMGEDVEEHINPDNIDLTAMSLKPSSPENPAGSVTSKVGSELSMLFAVGEVDDYQLLKQQVEQADNLLVPLEIRLRVHLNTYSDEPAEYQDAGYDTVKQAHSSTCQLLTVCEQLTKISSLFWLSQLPPRDQHGKFVQHKMFKENLLMKASLKKLQLKYKQLQESSSKRHNKDKEQWERQVASQLSETWKILRQSNNNFQQKLGLAHEKGNV